MSVISQCQLVIWLISTLFWSVEMIEIILGVTSGVTEEVAVRWKIDAVADHDS